MLITQKNHWAEEVSINIAKSNTVLRDPDFQPEQAKPELQRAGSCTGEVWESFAPVLPRRAVALPGCGAAAAAPAGFNP